MKKIPLLTLRFYKDAKSFNLNVPFYIAKRYLFSKSKNATVNIISLIAMIGVIIGTMALFIVLSVFSGLKTFNINYISASDPDLTIISSRGKSFDFSDKTADILKDKSVLYYSKYVEERALFSYNDKRIIANIKGVDSLFINVIKLDTTVYTGKWLDNKALDEVVIGNNISKQLSLGIADFITPLKIHVPKPGKGYINSPNEAFKMLTAQPVGVFAITEELDSKYMFCSLLFAQELLSYSSNQITGIVVKLNPKTDVDAVAKRLNQKLGASYNVKTRAQLNAVFYKMLNTENLVSYFIFTLILIIGIFNVIGAIVMLILDKKENLKTLLNLGFPISKIKQIFVLHGLLLQAVGMFIGLVLGVVLILIQMQFSLLKITNNLAYPVDFRIGNLMIVILTISVLGFLAAKLASNRISLKILKS